MLHIFLIKLYIMSLIPYVSTVIFFVIFVKIINNYFFIYFPKQNLEKILLITSSVTLSPVIFPNSSKISLI